MIDNMIWNRLSFMEKLSNIDGEVERLLDDYSRYKSGLSHQEHFEEYLERIKNLITLTFDDQKNSELKKFSKEFYDEVEEINRFLNGEVDADYIRRYWKQYTDAIS